jgi:hypothetical protein
VTRRAAGALLHEEPFNFIHLVGRCTFPASKPVSFKAPMVSALQSIISQIAFKLRFQIEVAAVRTGPVRRGDAAPGRGTGRAGQVDPIKHTLKAPGTRRLKLEFDELLSSFAFSFKLRRYTLARAPHGGVLSITSTDTAALFGLYPAARACTRPLLTST